MKQKNFLVAFRCPNPDCGEEIELAVPANTRAEAMRSGGPKCPHHDHDMEPKNARESRQ